jgi:hypothetical protein
MIHQTLRFFLIPAMLGVIGGLMASAVGMLVGQSIVFLWQTLYRRIRGQRPEPEDDVLLIVDEKPTLMAEDELPRYQDVPPQYRDVESQHTEEKN